MAIQGFLASLKIKAGGYEDASAWLDVDLAQSVTVTMEKGEIGANSRGNSGWNSTLDGRRDATLEFEMLWEPGDAAFEAIKDAWLPAGDGFVGVCAMDEDTASGEGVFGDFSILSWTKNEPDDGAQTVSVSMKIRTYGGYTTTGIAGAV